MGVIPTPPGETLVVAETIAGRIAVFDVSSPEPAGIIEEEGPQHGNAR
jgi:hypothetical protein